MKSGIILLISTLMATSTLFSQVVDSLKPNIDIHVMPTYIGNPRVRIGAEYRAANNLGFVLDIGYANGLIQGPYYNLFEIRPELKYYVYEPSDGISFYTSIELYWIEMNQRIQGGAIEIPNSNKLLTFERADKWSKRTGFHVKSGMRLTAKNKRVTFDFYWGVGVGNYRKHYSNIENIQIWEPSPDEYLYYKPRFRLGLDGAGHLYPYQEVHWTAGFKIGYIFWRKK